MKTHSLIQGSAEWLHYRSSHFNASDAPAMMGCSAYKTRNQLLHEMHTGLSAEVDAATQRRFDDGHRFEALARPLAEKIIDAELYPVTGSEGRLSASFDGLTMDEAICFEHKSLNDELRSVMVEGGTGANLALMYRVQMEQQLMISGADKCLFMASKWQGETLVEERHTWYTPDADLRAAILQGWTQFAFDLAAYVPSAEAAPVAVGRAPETLPALRIEVTGMVTASNLTDFKNHALTVFGGINRELSTDAQFADAEKTVKWCADVEERLVAAKQHALSQTESIDALFRTIDDISAEARKVRLELAGLVKARKISIREDIFQESVKAFQQHLRGLDTRLGKAYMPEIANGFLDVMRSKRTVDSLRDAVDTELARLKIESNAIADKIQINLGTLRELATAHAFLFADAAAIVLKAPDDLTMLVKSRIAEHVATETAKEEATRERVRAEEQAKAAAPVAAPVAAPAANVVALPILTPQEAAARILAARLPSVQKTPPALKLGQIGERLGFALTGDFLKTLGFEPAASDKSALLFNESDFPFICEALVSHIQRIQAKQAA
jgi:predicted phage-related endonuclease